MIERRKLITLIGSAAAAWPFAARAQQPAMPVIGILGATTLEENRGWIAAIFRGLKEAGFVEGQNLAAEYRWAEGQYDRLPALAAELVARRIAVIVPVGGVPPTSAAKAATSAIPVVFNMGGDPVRLGLVASLNRPGGNLTGVSMLVVETEAKRFALLGELAPAAKWIAVIVNPDNAQAETQVRFLQAAAAGAGRQLLVLRARTGDEIEAAFAALVRERAGALLVGGDTFFGSQISLFVSLAHRHGIPVGYNQRDYVERGGLMSYGPNFKDAYRQAGVYVGRVLKGEKPADLPIMQSSKFEFVLNLNTAKMLGLTVSNQMQLLADEVIE
jgi:putative ABC transport system substrate-binding protein